MDKNDALLLENQLCFHLYASSRALNRMYRPILDELGLTYPQYLVLLALWSRQECSAKELSEVLFLDPGTLTPMLKRMEKIDLIKRQRLVEDERVLIVTITEKGLALREKAFCMPEALFASSGLSLDELIQFNIQARNLLLHVDNYSHETSPKSEE